MTVPLVISNSSPLIALERNGHLQVLQHVFGAIQVPPAVVREVTPALALPTWITEMALTKPVGPPILAAALGPGESEAISLALEMGCQWIILDDRPARRLALSLGLPVVGTLGVLLTAKRGGFLMAVRPCLDALIRNCFRIAPDLYDRVLAAAGEGP